MINVWPVIRNHYADIINDSPSAWLDLIILLIIPLGISLLAIPFSASMDFVLLTATALTILFGFTFNAAVLLAGTDYSEKEYTVNKAIRMTKGNTLYALLIAFVTLVTSFAVFISIESEPYMNGTILVILSGILYYLLTHYLITLLMVLRRLYILLEGNMIDK